MTVEYLNLRARESRPVLKSARASRALRMRSPIFVS
jgi:hypothetical protein